VSRWSAVRIGEVADPVDRSEVPLPGVTYRQVGVRLWGEGAYERESMDGAATKYKTLNRVESGDIIVNKIWARNGSVSVVTPALEGCFCSGEFPLFRPRTERLDPQWFYWITKTRWFWDACDRQSRGTSGKNRLRPQRFLEITIPLAPIEEQRRVVEKLNRLSKSAHSVLACSRHNGGMVEHLWCATLASAFPETADTTLGDFAAVQSGYAFKSEWFEADGIRLVRNVNIGHGTVTWGQQACIAQGRRHEFGRFELELGDILVSLDRPIISTGVKVARIRQVDLPSLLLQRVGRIQMRAPELDPDYLYLWLRSPRFVNAIDPGRSNGVPHISPKDIERLAFATPSLVEQKAAVSRLRRLETIVHRAASARSVLVTEAEAILTSALRDAFESPASDRSACA